MATELLTGKQKKLKKKFVRRRLKTAALMIQYPHRFDMKDVTGYTAGDTTCETTHCIAGWARVVEQKLPVEPQMNLMGMYDAAEFLGIEDWTGLFTDYSITTPEEAAARLLAEPYYLDWPGPGCG